MKFRTLFFILISLSLIAMDAPRLPLSQQVMEEALAIFEKDEAIAKLKQLFNDPQYSDLKKLTDNAKNLNAKDKSGEPVLLHAISKGWQEIAALLIKAGANVNVQDKEGATPLMYAVGKKWKEIIKLLIAAGADTNAQDINKVTALRLAILKNDPQIIELLLSKPKLIEDKKKEEAKLIKLFEEALKDYEKDEQQAIAGLKKLLQETDLLADDTLFVQQVKNYVKRGASINMKDKFGKTALMIASGNPNVQTVREFLRMGANPYIENSDGWPAIFYAIDHGLPENVKLLINQGVNIDRQYGNGETALLRAVKYDKPEIVKLLLDMEANKNVKNRQGQSALGIAINHNNEEIMNLLEIKRWSD